MCGLFGYISKNPKKFNWDKFNILGFENDSRGGDSIGRVINNNVERWVNDKSTKTLYRDYVVRFKNPDIKNIKIALGHTRKASVGKASIDLAQPVVLPVNLENGDVGSFIMIHNGTLYNHEELAEKYNVSHKDVSDSMVLAEIIRDHGFSLLSE